ncbi:MAG TPA: hypothetical protein VK163_04130 [Opitutaceae bacterium]|nr:hypothetical protein [Opitutaceae bacterium]
MTLSLFTGWTAAANQQAGCVRYSLNEPEEFRSGAAELYVFRFRLKEEFASQDNAQLAKALVVADGLQFHDAIYGKRSKVRLVPARDRKLTSPVGEVRCFEFDRPQAGPVGRLFTSIALIIPPDVAQRRVVYLIIGYETRAGENPRYLDLVEKLAVGLREAPTKASGSVGLP